MKYFKRIRWYLPEVFFIALIVLCFFIYFVVYMTPSRVAWYREMRNQTVVFYEKLTTIGR